MYAVHVFTLSVSFFFISFFLSLGANDFYTFDQSIAQVCIHLYIFDSLQYVYIQRWSFYENEGNMNLKYDNVRIKYIYTIFTLVLILRIWMRTG